MPKRSNPFGDHSSLQLKTNLLGKETANGNCQQTRIQSAYACHNCRQPLQHRDVMKCQFCENYICCSCVKQCRNCHLHFCHLCLVIKYNQSTERTSCVNCQGR